MLIGGQATSTSAAIRIRQEAMRFLAVGEHVIDIDTLRIVTSPDAARLTPKAAAVLLQLARAAGRTQSRDDLLNEVWKGTCPTPDVLTQAVKDLRRALGDDLHAPRYVETLPRLGYRLVAPARFLDAQELPSSPGAQTIAHPQTQSVPAMSERSIVRWLAIGACIAFAIALAGAFAMYKARSAAAALQPRWSASAQRAITADPGAEMYPRISPDGTRIAYSVADSHAHNARIVQRSLAQSRVLRLTETELGDEFYPVWSPDGATIAFMRYVGNQCQILIAPSTGGPERLVDSCFAGAVNYFSWAPDAKHVLKTIPTGASANDLALSLTSTEGGPAEPIAYDHAPADMDLEGRYSPDGKRIAFRRGGNPYSDLFLIDANGGNLRQLTHLASRIRGFDWTRDGSALIFSSSHAGGQGLYTVAVDDGHIDALGVNPAEFPSAARASDTLVYEIPRLRTQLATIALDGAEPMQDPVASTGNDSAPTFAPVDDRLAFISDRSGSQQLWLHDPATSETFPLTDANEPNLRYPVWRPDGERVLITARGTDIGSLTEIDIATRTSRVLTSADEDVRYGVYGNRPNMFIAVVGGSGRGRELIEFESAGQGETGRHVLARDVGRLDYDRTNAAIYFTKVAEPGLFRLEPSSGTETLITNKINPAHLDGWLVLDGKIYYIAPQATGPTDFHVLDPETGDDRSIAVIPDSIADFNFSLSHDGKHLIVVRVAEKDTDVGALTLTRVGDR